MKTVKISHQNFTVWYQPNKPSVRKILLNKLPYTASSLRTVKFCRHFFHFSFFLLPNFLAKTTKNTVKHEKLPYVRKIFRKLDPFFFPESPKFALFWGGVALNFLELPICHKNCTYLSTTMRTQVSYTICHCHISAHVHNTHQSNLRKNTVLKLPRDKTLYL